MQIEGIFIVFNKANATPCCIKDSLCLSKASKLKKKRLIKFDSDSYLDISNNNKIKEHFMVCRAEWDYCNIYLQ